MFLLGLFYTTKNINKLMIHKSYDDCIIKRNTFVKKYPDYKSGIYTYDYVKTFNEEKLIDWRKYGNEMDYCKKILIKNLMNYCENYPDEKVCKSKLITEYKKFPYRLTQNIESILSDLDKN